MAGDLIRLGATTACALLALLLARAALHKLGDRLRFEGVLADYALVPQSLLRPMVRIVPGIELACALALAVPPLRPLGALAAAGLLSGYGLAMAINLLRGRSEIDCGCGGAPEPLGWRLVARNLILVAAVLPAGGRLGGAPDAGETMVAWGLALTALLIWGAVEQLAANAGRMRAGQADAALSSFGGA